MNQTPTTKTIVLSSDRPTGNFWVDTGIVVLLQQFRGGEHEIESVIEWFLSRPKGEGEGWLYPANRFVNLLVRGTIEVLNQYLGEVFKMDEQFQRILAGFEHSLGKTAQEHNEMGLLYALCNAKNPEDFYRVLNDAQFRLEVTIPEAILRIERGERIAGVPWLRVKTILSIYAMNAYLRRDGAAEESPSASEATVSG